MYELKDMEKIEVTKLAALDLRDEASEATDGAEAYRLTLRKVGDPGETHCAETAELLWIPSINRAGIAWGSDGQWTDSGSPEEAVTRYIAGELIN